MREDLLPPGQDQGLDRLRIGIVAVRQHRHKSALLHGRLTEKVAKSHKAGARQSEVEKKVGAIGANRSLHGHHDPLALLEHRPLYETREAGELQAIMPREISGLRRHAVAVQIIWAAGDDASDFTEANRDQPAVAKRPDPDRDVDLIGRASCRERVLRLV